jgi:hypothetical protein
MSVYVLKPKDDGTKLLLFGDYHGSFQGECENENESAVKIYSPEFLARLAAHSRSAVIVSEAFYQPELVSRLLKSPQLLRSHLADLGTVPSPGPLNQFLYALLEPCLLKQHKDAPKSVGSLLRRACPYDNIQVLWGDVRQIKHADGEVRSRFYWESLLVDLLVLMGPNSLYVPIEHLTAYADGFREGLELAHNLSGLEPLTVLQQLVDTVRSLVFGTPEPRPLAPEEHSRHSLLWKQLRKIPKSEHGLWTSALVQYCERVEPIMAESVRGPRFRAETERFFADLAAWVSGSGLVRPPSHETDAVSLVCGALLTDCYAMLRLRGKYPDADRAVFYFGQAHIKEIAKFYTEILGSHTLEFKRVNQQGLRFRCLELGPGVSL